MRRHHHYRALVHECADFVQLPLYDKAVPQAKFAADQAASSRCIEQSGKKKRQKPAGEEESADAKGTDNLLGIAMNNIGQQFLIDFDRFFGFFIE